MLYITFKTPDTSRRGMNKLYKEAIDHAFAKHRRRYMHRHFDRGALRRYPREYANSPSHAGKNRARRLSESEKLSQMSKSERAAYFSKEKVAARARTASRARHMYYTDKRRNRDRANLRPLYKTSRLMETVVDGSVIFKGPLSNRRMVFNTPFYVHIKQKTSKGTWDMVAATTAIAPDEEDVFAKNFDADLQAYLDKNTQVTTSK